MHKAEGQPPWWTIACAALTGCSAGGLAFTWAIDGLAYLTDHALGWRGWPNGVDGLSLTDLVFSYLHWAIAFTVMQILSVVFSGGWVNQIWATAAFQTLIVVIIIFFSGLNLVGLAAVPGAMIPWVVAWLLLRTPWPHSLSARLTQRQEVSSSNSLS